MSRYGEACIAAIRASPVGSPFSRRKFLRRDHDHLVAAMHGNALRSFAADAPHQFAEARLRILQEPLT